MGMSCDVGEVTEILKNEQSSRNIYGTEFEWENNIKMNLREASCDVRKWMNLVQDRDQWRTFVRR